MMVLTRHLLYFLHFDQSNSKNEDFQIQIENYPFLGFVIQFAAHLIHLGYLFGT